MIGMYWDTSTEWIVIEIFEFSSDGNISRVLYSTSDSRPKEASTRLVVSLQTALREADVRMPDWIFVASGPGSFTGIRIAVATARNLSQLWAIPCVGIDNMELYSRYYHEKFPNRSILTVLDGKMKRYFVNHINQDGRCHTTRDLYWEEVERLKEELSPPNLVFSHTPLPIPHKLFSEDYPRLTGQSLSNYWNSGYMEKPLERFHYNQLEPKYMRETYATESIPKS